MDVVSTHMNNMLEAPQMDPVILSVANLTLAGKSVREVALELRITPDLVSNYLNKQEVKEYINTCMLSQGYLSRVNLHGIINKAIASKFEEALETGVFGKHDLLDWIKLALSEQPKEKAGPQVAVQVNNNYEQLLSRLADNA